MKKTVLAVLALTAACAFRAGGQTCDLSWDVAFYGAGATSDALPFWAVTNKNGIVPDSHSGFIVAGTDFVYGSKPGIDVYAGVRFSGSVTPSGLAGVNAAPAVKGYGGRSASPGHAIWNGMLNELYAGAGWKMLRLDLGIIDRPSGYGGLSLTGGNIIWSGNARSFPGYNLQVDWFEIPGTKGIFSVKANYADYKTIDDRFVDGAMLHNKSLFFKFCLSRRLHIQLGLEQWSMWSGNSPVNGPQPASFNDYIRVVCGLSGGSDATESDQINVLGDHRGRELIQLDWEGDSFTLSLAHDIPFEDSSGMLFQNFPDGVNTLFFSLKDRDRWVTDVLYEFVYTKWQSGPYHDTGSAPGREDEEWHILGGRDNYFNNGEYRSGWTNYGKVAGLPLFTASPVTENGIVPGVCNNRVVAHHVGVGGKIARTVPYRFKATYSRNYGLYSQSLSLFEKSPWQVSLAMEADVPHIFRHLPLGLSVGLYGDIGELYEDSFGLILKLSYGGQWSGGRK